MNFKKVFSIKSVIMESKVFKEKGNLKCKDCSNRINDTAIQLRGWVECPFCKCVVCVDCICICNECFNSNSPYCQGCCDRLHENAYE